MHLYNVGVFIVGGGFMKRSVSIFIDCINLHSLLKEHLKMDLR